MVIKREHSFIFKLTHKNVNKNIFLDTKIHKFLSNSEFPIFHFVDGQ